MKFRYRKINFNLRQFLLTNFPHQILRKIKLSIHLPLFLTLLKISRGPVTTTLY